MNKIRLFALLIVGMLFASSQVFSRESPSVTLRKERANEEYVRCMDVAKNDGISAMLTYVRDSQKGTPLVSNPQKLAQENCVADSTGLTRYEDLDEIVADDGDDLVPVVSPLITVKKDVPWERHVARPWTRDYLIELAQFLDGTSGVKKVKSSSSQILVASLVRSRLDQKRLSSVTTFFKRIKGKIKKFTRKKLSFADCTSDAVCSTHLTGATIDISLLGVDRRKFKVLAARLLEDREKGKILAIFEREGNHFHVFVIPPGYDALTENPAI